MRRLFAASRPGPIALTLLVLATLCVPSLVSIAISHSSGFLGFREGGYDGDALVIVAAEVAAVVLVLAGAAKAAATLRAAA